MPFCTDSGKKCTNGPNGPNIPLCFDHTNRSDPNSVSSGQKSVIGIGFGGSLFEEEQYTTPAVGNRHKDPAGMSDTEASEHLYDMPLMRSPLDSPVPLETLHLLSPPHAGGSFGSPRIKFESPASSLDKSVRSISPSSSGTSGSTSGGGSHPTSSASSEQFCDKNFSMPSELMDMRIEAAAWGRIGPAGGRLCIPECNVSLTIPHDAISHADSSKQLYVAVTTSPGAVPALSDKQVSIM